MACVQCQEGANMRIKNPNGSELVITPRSNGGVTITQGPAYVLIGPDEIAPLIGAIRHIAEEYPHD
jgi:hypothetical protein